MALYRLPGGVNSNGIVTINSQDLSLFQMQVYCEGWENNSWENVGSQLSFTSRSSDGEGTAGVTFNYLESNLLIDWWFLVTATTTEPFTFQIISTSTSFLLFS